MTSQAAGVALEALADAGLFEPDGPYFDYGETVAGAGSWSAHFCFEQPPDRACDASDSDSELSLEQVGDRLVVSRVAGALRRHGSGLIGYDRRIGSLGRPRHVYEPVRLSEDGRSVIASIRWIGPIPSPVRHNCALVVWDRKGNELYRSNPIPDDGPSVEGARDGLFSSQLPKAMSEGIPEIRCTSAPATEQRGPFLPSGHRYTLASGRFDDGPWGDYRGEQWRLVAWGNAQTHCFRLEIGLPDRDRGVSCSTETKRDDSDEHILTRVVDPGGGNGGKIQTIAHGVVSEKVRRIEFKLAAGLTVSTDLLSLPAATDVEVRFYVAFLAPEFGDIVVYDETGEVIDRKPLCSASCAEHLEGTVDTT